MPNMTNDERRDIQTALNKVINKIPGPDLGKFLNEIASDLNSIYYNLTKNIEPEHEYPTEGITGLSSTRKTLAVFHHGAQMAICDFYEEATDADKRMFEKAYKAYLREKNLTDFLDEHNPELPAGIMQELVMMRGDIDYIETGEDK